MPEWVELKTGAEKYEVSQIPDSVLQVISTEGLLESWLTYPLFYNILAWNTLQLGIDNITGNFNGLQELGRRPNAGTVMLNRYRQMDLHCINGLTTDDEIGRFALPFAFYEAIFSQEVFLKKLSEAERDELLGLALYNYGIKKGYPDDLYFIYDIKTSAVIAARLMRLANYAPFIQAIAQDEYLQVFVDHIELQGRLQSLETVIQYANIFINKK